MTSSEITLDAEQAVNDLLWVVNSPSLITESKPQPALDRNQIDPVHLCAFLAEKFPRRVGHYFEQLVFYWLAHIRRVEIVAHRLQVHDGQITRGELDLVFRDEQGCLTHWEVAVKYYLYEHSVPAGQSHFIGPNARDTFEKKTRRLFEQQLELSRLSFPEVEHRTAFVRGIIFYDSDQPEPGDLPDQMSPDHLRGRLLRKRELDRLESHPHGLLRILPKPFWLTSAHRQPAFRPPKLIEHLRDHFENTDNPVMLSRLEATQDTIEVERLFVVADDWPALPTKRPQNLVR